MPPYNDAVRIVVAPQAFKGSLSAREACRAIREGVLRVLPEAEVVLMPMADGGDGTLEALVEATGGSYRETAVLGPLGDEVLALWGVTGDGESAVIEMARASGLVLVPQDSLDPRRASTYGTGQLIRAGLDAGCRRMIIGIGGSATNDGGAGMATALGARYLDAEGKVLPEGGAALARLVRIDLTGLDRWVGSCEFLVACDVTNPLTGPEGASAVYGPQKGATPEVVQFLDAALSRYGEVLAATVGRDVSNVPGAGAAGGLGAGLMAFLDARLQPGVDLIANAVGLDAALVSADLVITGEGRLDGQTVYNKVPVGVARRAKAKGLPVIALAGTVGEGHEQTLSMGIDAVETLTDGSIPLEEAIANAYALLADAAERAMRSARWVG
ncbi:MAG: glycerate kinase [Chloroflexi bacterium]|jgi:glycerate kinase|nr:MAG: glycerate kinase [Chloroflexota bacterium]